MKTWIWFFDLGTKNNYKQLLGDSVLGWFVPNIPKNIKEGDGKKWNGRVYDVNEPRIDPNAPINPKSSTNPKKNKTD